MEGAGIGRVRMSEQGREAARAALEALMCAAAEALHLWIVRQHLCSDGARGGEDAGAKRLITGGE